MRKERYVGRMSPIWQLLEVKATEHMRRHPNDWFQTDAKRANRLSGHAAGLSIDYSKQRVTDDVRLSVRTAVTQHQGLAVDRMAGCCHAQHLVDRRVQGRSHQRSG